MEQHLNVAELLLKQGPNVEVINKVRKHCILALFIKQGYPNTLAYDNVST